MRSRTANRHRSLIGSLGTLVAGASLVALLSVVGGLATPAPALAQSFEYQPPRPDPDGDYGANLEPFDADGPLISVISLGSQKIRVFDRNGMIASSKVSTGKRGHDTPEGIFSIIERKVEHNSNLYDDAEMPFMQRLTWSGIALHQGLLPGYRASHGCIRLPDGFAEQLFRTTQIGTRVVITSDEASPQPVSHPVLPQPGEPPAIPSAPAIEPDTVTPLTAPDRTGAINVAGTAEDASAMRAAVASVMQPKPQPSLAELRARRIEVEKRLNAATKAVNQAKVPVRPRLIAQGKAEKALRQAIALANRARGRTAVLAEAPFDTTTVAGWNAAVADHIESLVEQVSAETREDWARELAARSAGAAMAAQDHVRKLDAERQAVLNQFRAIARKLSPTESRSAVSSIRDFRRRPAVSNSSSSRGPSRVCQVNGVAIESRVSPGSGPVIIRSSPSSALTSVDLPAFGRPTIAIRIGRLGASSSSVPSSSSYASASSGTSPPAFSNSSTASSRSDRFLRYSS